MCYYFGNIIRFWDTDINFGNVLLNEKLYKWNNENILIDDTSYKTAAGAKPLRIRFDKTYGFIKVYNKIRTSVLFDCS